MQQVIENPEQYPELSKSERRKYPRTVSDTAATVRTKFDVYEFQVANLSVCGAMLTDGPLLEIGKRVQVTLHIPLYPDIEVTARIRRHGRSDDGRPILGLEFTHTSDVTEDHIQSALLSELERSQTDGLIADLVD